MNRVIKHLRELAVRRWEELSYLFFGVLTTVINYAVFFLFHILWPDRFVLLSNLIAFAAAVTFAFVTNKIYVFRSRDWSWPVLRREAGAFLAARVFSFGVEEAGLWAAAYLFHAEQYVLWGIDGILLTKVFLSVVVTVMNYFFSKFLIFKKADSQRQNWIPGRERKEDRHER